ncbi:hypothetical protein LY78DRAFT_142399 [Colletotrichum sublineola]|nr:hypothetical protein LY78DRAFT_142399 [Colletotrichum sublineola]
MRHPAGAFRSLEPEQSTPRRWEGPRKRNFPMGYSMEVPSRTRRRTPSLSRVRVALGLQPIVLMAPLDVILDATHEIRFVACPLQDVPGRIPLKLPQPSWRSRWCQATLILWGWVTIYVGLSSHNCSLSIEQQHHLRCNREHEVPTYPPSLFLHSYHCSAEVTGTQLWTAKYIYVILCQRISHTPLLDLLVFSWRLPCA